MRREDLGVVAPPVQRPKTNSNQGSVSVSNRDDVPPVPSGQTKQAVRRRSQKNIDQVSQSTSVLEEPTEDSTTETMIQCGAQKTTAHLEKRRFSVHPANIMSQLPGSVQGAPVEPVEVASTDVQQEEATLVVRHSSWMVSFCVHAGCMILFALIVLPQNESGGLTLDMTMNGNDDMALELDAFELEAEFESLPNEFDEQDRVEPLETEIAKLDMEIPALVPEDANPLPPGSSSAENASASMPQIVVAGSPGGVMNRSAMRNSALVLGATVESEQAVDRALRWLVAHQEKNGNWKFDLQHGACNGRCRHSGSGDAVMGATAIALLPFLGAGQTHEKGYHRGNIKRGLEFLIQNQAKNGSFQDLQGNMYSHGLATLVLCESLAMSTAGPSSSGDGRFVIRLRNAARKAVEFSVWAQHAAGGWRYMPRMPGDTSVLGWQAMAMRSAVMAQLDVPDKTLKGISNFLDSVSADTYGSTYGYTDSFPRPTMSAVGLLCRMYQGWGKEHAGIAEGVQQLSEIGPSSNNVYFNYYATQVVHHYGGKPWQEWNSVLRDHLVESQQRGDHESGSWYFAADHGSRKGGRLYITAMATMVLEVYYRHMPMYKENALHATGDF